MFRKNEKGSVLPLVLVVVAALTFLGVALLHYSVTETIQVSRDESKMKAQYVARSGAHAVANYLINNPEEAEQIIFRKSPPVDLGEGVFEVEVYGDLNTLFVESTGTVRDISQTVTVTVEKAGKFDFALFASDVTFGGNCLIRGDIIYKISETIGQNVTVEGVIIRDPDRTYPDVEFPEYSELLRINDIVKESGIVSENSWCDKIELNNKHHVLKIVLGVDAQNSKDIILRVGSYDTAGGTIILEGHGRLLLFVDNSFTIGGNYETTSAGDAHTIVFVAPNATFTQHGTSNFEGIVYAPSADFVTQGGGHATNVVGTVIARSISGNGNVEVTFKEFDTKFLPLQIYSVGIWRYK